jgi:hypothetical protein
MTQFYLSVIIHLTSIYENMGSFRPDQRITIAGKGIGTIAFVGKTEFADGK